MDAPADAPVLPPALAGLTPKQHIADIVNAVRARRRAGRPGKGVAAVRACVVCVLLSALPPPRAGAGRHDAEPGGVPQVRARGTGGVRQPRAPPPTHIAATTAP
jgi:hypothetical protein